MPTRDIKNVKRQTNSFLLFLHIICNTERRNLQSLKPEVAIGATEDMLGYKLTCISSFRYTYFPFDDVLHSSIVQLANIDEEDFRLSNFRIKSYLLYLLPSCLARSITTDVNISCIPDLTMLPNQR